jgi:hypothetical protein
MTTPPVRPIASGPTRLFGYGIGGGAISAGIALWADSHYTRAPKADGTSAGYIDKYEARNLFSGFDGAPAIGTFMALLPASYLYTRGKVKLTEKEFSFLRNSYRTLGGALVGTVAAPYLLKPQT